MSKYIASPLSLYSIPLVIAAALYPQTKKYSLIQEVKGYNNVQPRSNMKSITEDPAVPKDVAQKIERCEGAHNNGMENLPIFIGAVLAGHIAGVGHETLNVATSAYFALRTFYNYVYINQTTKAASGIRTALFWGSLGIPVYLYVKAANLINARGI